MRGLHWSLLVEPDQLLARLALERTNVQLRLTRLLLPLYLPKANKDSNANMEASKQSSAHGAPATRLMALVASGSLSAKRLLSHSPHFTTDAAALRVLKTAITPMLSSSSDPAELARVSSPTELPPRQTPMPPAQLAACLDCIAALVEALAPNLPSVPLADADADASRADGTLGAVLSVEVMDALTELAKPSFGAQRALTRIAACLPARSVPGLASDCLRQLAASHPRASAAKLAPLVSCACAWGQDGKLLGLIGGALRPAGGSTAGSKRGRKSSSSKSSSAASKSSDVELSTPLAYRIL